MPRFNKEICSYIDSLGIRRKFREIKDQKEPTTYNNNRYIKVDLVNARSLKRKIGTFLHEFLENSYDIGFIMETWLKDNDTVKIEEINSNNLTFLNYQRHNNKAYGIGLIFKKHLNIQEIETGEYESLDM